MSDRAHTEAVLHEEDWTAHAARHRRRAEEFLTSHTVPDQPHPVWDFLFSYYSLRPAQLLRWHPGYGVRLTGRGARDYLGRAGYIASADGVEVGQDYLHRRLDTVRFIADLLAATAARPALHGCFGMHEWAMVYRSTEIRHHGVPLRLGSAGTNAVVETVPLRCSHFDAYRFFTPAARPRNATELSRPDQIAAEQPGCVHANMDLYKWCYKLGPLLESSLLLDCLELAALARALDMRASPYDLTDYGLAPIRVENSAGRAEYVRLQTGITERAAPLRAELLKRCQELLAHPAAEAVSGLHERV